MSARPALLASMLRQHAGVVGEVPVDLDPILDECSIEVAEVPLDGFLGLYLPPPDGPAILIDSGQSSGQRRFTLAHELGHFALPTHAREAEMFCLAEDFHSPGLRSQLEREANGFAAELLMPRAGFGAAVRNRDPTFSLVKELAAPSKFWVSRTAAAIRTVELSRESCALVCSERGRVKWWLKSPNCDFYLERDRNSCLPPGSVAAAILNGEAPNEDAEEIDPGTWFDPGNRPLQALESTFLIPTMDQVLSIIWAVEVE